MEKKIKKESLPLMVEVRAAAADLLGAIPSGEVNAISSDELAMRSGVSVGLIKSAVEYIKSQGLPVMERGSKYYIPTGKSFDVEMQRSMLAAKISDEQPIQYR